MGFQQTFQVWFLVAFLFLVVAVLLIRGCGAHPQIGEDDAAFKEVDALYTAVTSKKRDLLEDCRKRLVQLEAEKKLSAEAFQSISSIIEEAEGGEWQSAAQRLHNFMRAQRRESKR